MHHRNARRVYIDIETRAVPAEGGDLPKIGVYVYAKAKRTQCIVARFRIDDGPHLEWRLGDPMLDVIIDAAADPLVTWVAHNAAFERVMWLHCLHPRQGWPPAPPLDRWECTMARARACALPGGLEGALIATGANVQKNMQGHRLMLQMCKPRSYRPDGSPIWWDDNDRMQRLADYCGEDVDGSRALDIRLPKMSASERAIWIATEEMNDHGVRFDLPFVRDAIAVADEARDVLNAEMADITSNRVPAATNVGALKRWLMDMGVDLTPPEDPFADPDDDDGDDDEEGGLPELRKADLVRLLLDDTITGRARRALEIRLEAGKTSTKKLDAILRRSDADGYARGMIAYHGTNTGRDSAAGGGIQIQNFPRDTVEDWDTARLALTRANAVDQIEVLFGPPLDTISRMLRGAIIPDDGCDLISIDYAAVELHGVAWLAGQQDLVEALRNGGKIYEQMAGAIYGVPPATIGKESRERWIGKQVVLGSGYQMGYQKFWRMCAGYGVKVEVDLARRAIETYRDLYPCIPALWYEMNDAMIKAVRNPGMLVVAANGRIKFLLQNMWLRMQLPSGRALRYAYPKVEVDERFNREGVTYMGVHPKTKQWGRQRTFGGRIVENAVQGLCRDLLMAGARRLSETGRYRPFTRVHDETVMNIERGKGSVEEARDLLCIVPEWARGFPLRAEGWIGARYG